MDYRPGLDDLILGRSPITPERVAESDAIAEHGEQLGVLPHTYTVRGVAHCNQLRADQVICDWTTMIEAHPDEIERECRRAIFLHLSREHRLVGKANMRALTKATHFMMHDVGR